MLDLFQHLIPFVLRPRNKPDLERISPGFGMTEQHFWDSRQCTVRREDWLHAIREADVYSVQALSRNNMI